MVKFPTYASLSSSLRMDCAMAMEMRRHFHYQSYTINSQTERFLMKEQCPVVPHHQIHFLQLQESPSHRTPQEVVGCLAWQLFTEVTAD